MTESVAALIGALVGGALAFFASWWQTKRVLAHETKQAREAAEEARKAGRHAVSRLAVVELLRVLAEVERDIPYLGRDRGGAPAIDLLATAQAAQVPLLPEAIQKRWAHLQALTNYIYSARPVSTDTPDRTDWTEVKITRARDDVTAYLSYVRRSLVALIDEQDLPPDAAMPNLRRTDMSVWLPPDQGGPSA